MTRHLTPGERRAQQSAQAAIARALTHTHTRPTAAADADADEELGRQYPYVTPARARAIRHELEETRHP